MLTPVFCPHEYRNAPAAVQGANEQSDSHKLGDQLLCLTAQQRRVAELVGQGLSNKLIAHQLGIEEATVKVHLRLALAKLGLKRRYQVPAIFAEDKQVAAAISACPLTHRQKQVVKLIGEGMNNRQIGIHVGISEGSVKTHLRFAFKTLGIANRTQAAAWASENAAALSVEG